MRILAAQVNPTVGEIEENTHKILAAIERAKSKKVDVVLFPELTISGYFPDDLLLDETFIDACAKSLSKIGAATEGLFVCVGLPRRNEQGKEKPLYNSVAVFADGKMLGYKDKTLLPTYDIFDERRYFEPGTEEPVWEYLGYRLAVTICEDVWQHSHGVSYTHYRRDPILELKEKRPDLLLNVSGSPYDFYQKKRRISILQTVARTLKCPVVLCNQVGVNDQIVFDGHSFYLNERGELIQVAKGFVEDDLVVDLHVHACQCERLEDPLHDLYAALVVGVHDYFHKQGFTKGVIGLSGGVDSALVACIAVEALKAENVLCVGLPTRYSSPGSITDAKELAKNLGVEFRLLPIDSLFQAYLDLLGPVLGRSSFDETEENLQSRIRGMVLMAISNKQHYILLNTGNKSEMAMGYTTLYGDMAGGLGVLHDVTKLRVYELASYINRKKKIIPQTIIDKIPSAELRENQTDFETLPPYEVLDPVIEDYLEGRLTPEEIAEKRHLEIAKVEGIIQRIHLAEYKRRQAPIGIRVTSKAFSRGRYVPIVQKWK